MPTARELLEQADALMRRNRSASALADETPQIPLAAASPPPPGGLNLPPSPRPIQREPIAPSIARTALPVDPTDAPTLEVPRAEPRSSESPLARSPLADPGGPTPARTGDEGADAIPLLTDAVDPAVDDLPILTDAIEEIDVAVVGDKARGEPSFWLDPPVADASVLGPAPDSVAVVPPPELPVRPPEGRDPLGLDQPAQGFELSPTMLDEAREAALEPLPAAMLAPEPEAPDEVAEASGGVAADAADAADGAPVWASGAPVVFAPAVAAGVLQSPAPGDLSRAESGAAAQSPGPSPSVTPDEPAAARAERVQREIAEEIRMQVLQRIDIFTDTGLREQLGERLKPLVDRASAELVDAINQHVGEILRGYVAEAIEREIESWRNRQS